MAGGKLQEPMSKVDTAWLRMESPTNLMMITGVMMFDHPMDVGRFKRMLAERFLAFRRFRQKAVDSAGGAHWETDRDFDLDWHVRITALPGGGGQKELQHLVSQLASTPLDHSKPLWQFHVVERYAGGGSALITRIHHCYADGLALVQVLLSLTDAELKREKVAPLTKAWLKEDRGGVLDRLLEPARAGLSKAVHVGEKVLGKGIEMLSDPAAASQLLDEGSAIAREFAQAVTLPDDPPTPFKGALGVTKRVAWMEPLDLDVVKTVGRALDCTVNDVLMASVAGALRSYLRDRDEAVDGLTIRATVPVSLRPLEHAKKLGNHFGLVFLELPIGEPNPLRRLERVAGNMREIKRSRQAVMSFGLLAALGMGPSALQRPALELFSRKATAVATNVPGPADAAATLKFFAGDDGVSPVEGHITHGDDAPPKPRRKAAARKPRAKPKIVAPAAEPAPAVEPPVAPPRARRKTSKAPDVAADGEAGVGKPGEFATEIARFRKRRA